MTDVQVSGHLFFSLWFALLAVNSITDCASITSLQLPRIYSTYESKPAIYGEVLVSVLIDLKAVIWYQSHITIRFCGQCFSTYVSSKKRRWLHVIRRFYGATTVNLYLNVNVCFENNALAKMNDGIGWLLHLAQNVIAFWILLHLGPNVITLKCFCHTKDNYYTSAFYRVVINHFAITHM